MPASPISATVRRLILARRQAAVARENRQHKLIADEMIFANVIAGKLAGRFREPQFLNFLRCGVESLFRTCSACRSVEKLTYRCNIKWCPRCQWRIAEKRRLVLTEWTKHLKQPKHLVTTQKNFPVLTHAAIRSHQKNLVRLRRHACFSKVAGGCVSVEITNEGKGWHLHAHWLLDVRWLDVHLVQIAWAALVKQDFSIVKIKDLRGTSYTQEVCKYLAKGSEIASWPAEHVHEFVRAIYRSRFFFAFGSLFKQGPQIRVTLRQQEPEVPPCDCGCDLFFFETEQQAVMNEIRRERR